MFKNLDEVFARFREANLKVNPKKSVFLCQQSQIFVAHSGRERCLH